MCVCVCVHRLRLHPNLLLTTMITLCLNPPSAHAEENGANAVAAMPPTYIRPGTLNALVVTMAAIAGAAPTTPFYYYVREWPCRVFKNV